MGRGRGGHRGRSDSRGGGLVRQGGSRNSVSHSRIRGRGSNRGGTRVSGKGSAHLKQFGEVHPAYEVHEAEMPPKKSKFSQRAPRTTGNAGHGGSHRESRPNADFAPDFSDESESEEEVTPYGELLSIFTEQKKPKEVQIGSDSEEDEEEQPEDSLSESESDVEVGEVLVVKEETSGEPEIPDQPHMLHKLDEEDEVQEEMVIEPELGEETVIDEAELDPEAANEADTSLAQVDPFLLHFEKEIPSHLQLSLNREKPYETRLTYTWPELESFHYLGLKTEDVHHMPSGSGSITTLDISAVKHSKVGKVPDPPPHVFSGAGNNQNQPVLESLFIKAQLHSTIPMANKASIEKKSCVEPITPLQTEILSLITQYHDMYLPGRTVDNEEEIRLAFCIHAVNHVLKTRTRILHHNAKMINKIEVPDEYRDQGFVRPKVLILTPFKETALRIVNTITSLILQEEKGNVQNKKRFVDEYSGETLFMPKTNPKPDDYMATFAGNVDDNFKIGLAITKKVIKLYTGFYSSDIIIASPLGLRLIIGAEGEKSRDYDFLSSVEILILDQADIFLMQSWDHVLHLMRHLHMQPVTTHGTDFARIRPWALDNLSKFYCQSIMFSSLICPEHIAFFSRHCKNYAGFVKVLSTTFKGSISRITVQLPQVFQQFDCVSLTNANDARFEYFVNKVLPNFKGRLMSHTLIFVSSYFDFVRLRNYFKKEETSFVQICEYTKDKKIARARDLFFHGKNHFMVYTERAHFFRRFRLKGIGHIIFYQLPQYPQFYPELCNSMQAGFQNRRVRQRKNCSVNVLYCKYDATRLATIVGTDRANYMLTSDKKTHAFVSGEL